MKDPARLLNASASELEGRLLRAGAAEQPPPAAAQRLAAQLGVRISAAEPSAPSSRLPLLAANKGLVVIAVVTLAGAGWLATRDAPAAPPQPVVAKPAAPSVSEEVSPPAAPQSSQSLALEIAQIDAVRRELAAGHAKPALAALEAYQRDFPSGVLRQEAELLNIEAHRQAGDVRRARTLAKRFLAANPQSPHTARVRDVLEALGPDAR